MINLLNRTASFLMMVIILMTLASANACAIKRDAVMPASADVHGSYVDPANTAKVLSAGSKMPDDIMEGTVFLSASALTSDSGTKARQTRIH